MADVLVVLLQTLSLYVWSEPDDQLLPFCAEKKVTRLYLMFSGKETPKLRAFVQAAHAAKIQVHAMHPGDMAEWLDPFPARLDHKVILDWVDAALKTGLFDGIHLDIEPHSTEAWKSNRLKLAGGYLDLLRQVLAREGLAVVYGSLRKALKIQSRHTLWDADHIRAVADGGGECGLENMQTLCFWCHRDKTVAMRKRATSLNR
jgi:hypothetical protein